ncbi:hypothetical protein AHF37_00591 [Paragonimus kellicotti]|nr:hypothetical protein AHF37_00591 [Paragonimus kellicotti]
MNAAISVCSSLPVCFAYIVPCWQRRPCDEFGMYGLPRHSINASTDFFFVRSPCIQSLIKLFVFV